MTAGTLLFSLLTGAVGGMVFDRWWMVFNERHRDERSMRRHAKRVNARIGREMAGCEDMFAGREF